ncbi:MAG TPA: aromatase/cyclase [Jatrophihabitans sp.]|nr:aromatase/cyclase [Jatrophihabitans sp.]
MVEQAVHSTSIPAPIDLVYELIADVTRWPVIFAPIVHVEQLERSPSEELFQTWALVNGTVKTWTSRRTFDPVRSEITFQQQVSQPPIASMGGSWRFLAEPDGGTAVELYHHFSAVDDDPQALDWIRGALDNNSNAELAGLRKAATAGAAAELELRFSDEVHIDAPAELAYRFIDEADQWPNRLPHVEAVELSVDESGAQHMTMETLAPDGSRHTTSSVRIRRPDSIVYKQIRRPALLTCHLGRWIFTDTEVSAEHTVVIDPDAVERVLGAGKTIADARTFARNALGGHSMITLRHAKDFAELGAANRSGG